MSGLMVLGFVFVTNHQAEAVAYVGNTNEIEVSAESNKAALEILEKVDGLVNAPISLDKITTEVPEQAKALIRSPRAAFKIYATERMQFVNGMYQYKNSKLALVGFNWTDNGVPVDATRTVTVSRFVFLPSKVWDTGVGAYDMGYYWRCIGTPWGSFWASVWNLNDLIYT